MTPTPEEKNKVAIEVAKRDVDDIKRLQEFEPFRRYFIRKLEARGAEVARSFKDDPPHKVDKEEREILRRILKEFETIFEMMDKDLAIYTATLPLTEKKDAYGMRGNG